MLVAKGCLPSTLHRSWQWTVHFPVRPAAPSSTSPSSRRDFGYVVRSKYFSFGNPCLAGGKRTFHGRRRRRRQQAETTCGEWGEEQRDTPSSPPPSPASGERKRSYTLATARVEMERGREAERGRERKRGRKGVGTMPPHQKK